jgi:hypothetical protein
VTCAVDDSPTGAHTPDHALLKPLVGRIKPALTCQRP